MAWYSILALFATEQHRPVVLFSWGEFLLGTAASLSIAMLFFGVVLAILTKEDMVSFVRVTWIFLGLSVLIVALMQGPFLAAVVLGRSDAWLDQIDERITFVIVAVNVVMALAPSVLHWIKNRRNSVSKAADPSISPPPAS